MNSLCVSEVFRRINVQHFDLGAYGGKLDDMITISSSIGWRSYLECKRCYAFVVISPLIG
jgi:hypothetical protein